MSTKLRIRLAYVLLALAGPAAALQLNSAPAQASVVEALSLEQLTRKADLIVVGTAQEAQARPNADGKLIVTDVSVQVSEVLKGTSKAGATVVVTLLGGVLDDLSLRVPGEAILPMQKPALLFLYRTPKSKELRVVGMSQGVLPLRDEQGTMMVIPSGHSSVLVENGADGSLRPAPDALMNPQPASSVLDRIRTLVGKR